ncbi:helix-turn-helix domain-containing protein [Paenibacillus campinasensis]|uniref:AraC family transcriptional regulator n=1 Tax=Paenibacillus campinasensis TaxID=66347 RepID=A0A268F0S7_9BACL|nr:helix-turn-helix domain-containing protein [Paenibacillus campinasensis]PAD78972.1 AraC family transcriptional regulator [Paenibacillus campinasensis]
MGKNKINLLTKLLVSYLLVLLFPVTIILFYYYPYSADVVKEKEMEWNAHITEQFMTSMDAFTRYVYNLPFELVQNQEFKMYQTEDNDYQRVLIAKEMKKYNATDAFIYNTLLYVKNTGYLFSKTGSAYSLEDMRTPGVGFYYERWPYTDVVNTLNTLEAPIVRPVEDVMIPGHNRVRMLTFLQPLPVGGVNSPGTVLIMVKEDTIIRMMRSVSEIYKGDFFIFDAQGKPLVASNESLYQTSDDVSQLVRGMDDKTSLSSGIHTINGSSYLVSHTVSDKNGWRYVSLLPMTDSLQGIRTIQLNTVMLVGGILLIEVVVIYLSIRKNYHPIKRLVDFAIHLFAPQGSQSMNEIDTIRYTLSGLSAANTRLDEKVKGTLPIMRDNLLQQLVNGQFLSWEEFVREGERVGVSLHGPEISVIVISSESSGYEDAALEHFREWGHFLPPGVQAYLFNSIYDHEFVMLCSHEHDFPLKKVLAQLQQRIKEEAGLITRFGIGKTVDSLCPQAVHISYLQALRTAEHLRLGQSHSILVFDEMEESQAVAVSYFADMLQSLELSILKNEAAMVESIIERLIGHLGSDGMPPHMIRSIYLNTASVIFNGLLRFRHDDQSVLRLTEAAFSTRYTPAQMSSIIRDSSAKLCEMIRETLPPSRSAGREDILAVVEAKAMDPNCSLQLMADHFGMSVSNFSHHFKKTIGQNFKEYIDRLRIQHAIRLLLETEETLDAIAMQAGYNNTSSFIRTFKKIVGVTPGQYRSACKG